MTPFSDASLRSQRVQRFAPRPIFAGCYPPALVRWVTSARGCSASLHSPFGVYFCYSLDALWSPLCVFLLPHSLLCVFWFSRAPTACHFPPSIDGQAPFLLSCLCAHTRCRATSSRCSSTSTARGPISSCQESHSRASSCKRSTSPRTAPSRSARPVSHPFLLLSCTFREGTR